MRVFLLLILCVAACSSDPVVPAPNDDAGTNDSGSRPDAIADAGLVRDAAEMDAAVFADAAVDAGVMFQPCADAGAACVQPDNCAAPNDPPGACETCPRYVHPPCISESCSASPKLDVGDVHEVSFVTDPSIPRLDSMYWIAVARGTPSGMEISCADVYAGNVDFSNSCYNVLDVRYREITQPGDTYALLFGSFTSGLPTLFVVYGFEETRARGQPAGVSCTEYQVGSPGTGVVRFEGGNMRLLP